jgi:hypothetical protein
LVVGEKLPGLAGAARVKNELIALLLPEDTEDTGKTVQ